MLKSSVFFTSILFTMIMRYYSFDIDTGIDDEFCQWTSWFYVNQSSNTTVSIATINSLYYHFLRTGNRTCFPPISIDFQDDENITSQNDDLPIEITDIKINLYIIASLLIRSTFRFRYCCANSTQENVFGLQNIQSQKVIDSTLLRSLDNDRTVCGQRLQIDWSLKTMSRIFGGTKAKSNAWPWMASICERGALHGASCNHVCGGTIIHKRFILTAAHCVNETTTTHIHVLAGANRRHPNTEEEKQRVQRSNVEGIHVHPEFNSNNFVNDIALIRLKTSFVYDKYVQPACLANEDPSIDDELTILGWGVEEENGTSPESLKEAKVNMIDNCTEYWSDLDPSRQICVGKRITGNSVCYGDSGGPLLMQQNEQYLLTGIVSYLDKCRTTTNDESPNVFTLVSPFKSWILSIVNQHSSF